MTSIAELGIRVDSTEAAQAATDLDKLTQAGGKAEKSTATLAAQSDKAEAALKDLSQQAQAAEKATAGFANQAQKAGVSAAQTAAALRGVPAQFTDIVTSLQGGQAPLTVLLQQGGQLKDMFGGVGPAARALGGYVAGLVNPFTVAAAAAATLGVAYYKGADEAEEFQKAIILTGNASGTTADSLAEMARQVSATVGTTGSAAEVLTQLASNGNIASESFAAITEAALDMQRSTGRAVEDTVAEFAKIAKDPVAAAQELNSQYHFLTQAVYSQIVALKEQNDTQGAAKVLTDAYVDTIRTRSHEVTENLSLWEKGWKALKGEVSATVDALKDVGREQTSASRIDELTKKIAYAKDAVRADPDDIDSKRVLANAQLELQFLTQQRDTQLALAAARKLDADNQAAAVLATKNIDSIEKAALTTAQKRNKALEDYARNLEAIRKVNPNDSRLSADTVAKTRANIAQQYKDPKAAAGNVDLSGFNAQKNALAELVSTYQNSYKELDAAQRAGVISQETYTAQRATLIRAEREEVMAGYEAEIAALEEAKGRASTSAAQRIQLDEKIADARTSMVKAQKDADSQLEVLATNEQGRLAKQAQAVKTYTDALNNQVETLRQQGQQAAATLGMGDRQSSLYQAQNAIDDRVNQQKLDLANQYGDGSRGMSLDEYNQKLAALNKTQQDLHDTVLANYNDMTAAQGNWSAGASAAWQNYLDNGQNVAGQMKTAFTDLYDGLTDSLVDFAFGADESFGDVAVSFAKMLAKMAVQSAASSVFSSIFGSIGTASIAGLGGAASSGASGFDFGLGSASSGLTYSGGFSSGGYTGDGGKFEPAGIVHGGEFVLRKEVVSQPGMRGYLEGLNARGYADGGYVGGVASRLAGSSSSNAPQVNINIASDGSSQVSSNTSGLESFGAEIGDFVTRKFKELEAKSLSPQGNIRKAINGRG
ncbi:phage tail tape measure protein [Pseudomonas massiliensis]|uniref:phage tail tape measure protein n=1 Tax=Pseudomonas massiliensis TaxID=522492 RepID=UPI0005904186|nr:phage tail tape measure protein [Pseudomonas massiliensis]